MTAETVAGPDRLRREAHARQWLAGLWAVVAVPVAVALVLVTHSGPVGRTIRVAAALLLVGALVAVVTAVVNHGLAQQPDRRDLGGPADLAVTALGGAFVVGVVVALLVGRPVGLAHLATLMLTLGAYLALGLVAVTTSLSARQRRRTPA